IEGIDFGTFDGSWEKRRAVERGLEIISEASRHIPDDLKSQHPNIPWRDIADIGNFLRHDYQHVESRIIWDTATTDLSVLNNFVKALLKNSPDRK
ncbi:MAG: DUF86 domain-containing protein, partial [Rhodospirillales bacterium]